MCDSFRKFKERGNVSAEPKFVKLLELDDGDSRKTIPVYVCEIDDYWWIDFIYQGKRPMKSFL